MLDKRDEEYLCGVLPSSTGTRVWIWQVFRYPNPRLRGFKEKVCEGTAGDKKTAIEFANRAYREDVNLRARVESMGAPETWHPEHESRVH